MPPPSKRLQDFMDWRDWKQAQLADAIGTKQANVSHILHGRKGAGLKWAHAIETLTAQPRPDGEVWSDGPIRTEEWLDQPKSGAAA